MSRQRDDVQLWAAAVLTVLGVDVIAMYRNFPALLIGNLMILLGLRWGYERAGERKCT